MLAEDAKYAPVYREIHVPILGIFAFSPHHPSDDALRFSDSAKTTLDD